jgi:hypothetical protein
MRQAMATLLVAGCCVAGPTFAGLPTEERQQPSKLVPSMTGENQLFDIDFEGGQVKEYLDLIRREAEKRGIVVNISSSAQANEFTLPPITLRKAEIRTMVYAIEPASQSSKGSIMISDIGGLYGVSARPTNGMGTAEGSARAITDVLSLGAILQSEPDGQARAAQQAKVLSAIEAVLASNRRGGSDMPAIKYHQDTSLLFVSGKSDDVQIVRALIERYGDDRLREARAEEFNLKRRSEAEFRIKRARSDVNRHEKDLADVHEKIKQLQASISKDADRNSPAAKELIGYEQQAIQVERWRDVAQIELQRATLEAARPALPVEQPANSTDVLDAIRRLNARIDAIEKRLGMSELSRELLERNTTE